MSKKLKTYVNSFFEQRQSATDLTLIRAKELKSLQKAIQTVAEDEWEKLTQEEKELVNFITAIDDEPWCSDVA